MRIQDDQEVLTYIFLFKMTQDFLDTQYASHSRHINVTVLNIITKTEVSN